MALKDKARNDLARKETPQPMSISRQFSSGVAWMAAGNWAEQGINFIVFVFLARLLGAESFGLLAMASAFVILSEFLVRETLSEYLIATSDPTSGHHDAAFWSLLGLGAILTLLLVLTAAPLAAFYGHAEVRTLILCLSPTILLIALTAVPVARLRRDLKFRSLSLRAIAGVAAGGVVGVGMAVAGYGVWSLAGQRLAQVAVNVAMAWQAVGWRPGFTARRGDFRQVLGFGSHVLGLRAAELAATQTPSVIIGATLGPAALGLFSISWRLVEIASFLIVTPLRMASQPAFASITRSGGSAAKLLLGIARLSGLAAFPVFFGLSVLAEPILRLLFGTQWEGAAPALSVLSLIGLYFCIEKVHQSFCLAAGRAGPITVIAWAEVALGAVLIWLAVDYDLAAVAAAVAGGYYLLWPFRLRVVAGLAGISVPTLMARHLGPLLAALAMAAVVTLVTLQMPAIPKLTVPVGILTGVVVFGGLTWAFMRDRLALVRTLMPMLKRPAAAVDAGPVLPEQSR